MIAHDLTSDTERTLDVQPSQKNTDFESFLLSPKVLKGLKECGFHRPSPIQVESIPLAKCGIDLVCQAKSGTGKTCVLGVCCLETVETKLNKVQALVLAPTREIAHQIHGVITHIGCFMDNLKCGLFIGGIRMDKDVEMLKNCHIAIGTPGRIKHLMENKMLTPTSIRLFIMDEADKLLEKGSFEEQINWIYSALPKEKQMLALSATYPEVLAQHLNNYMTNPIHVRINPKDVALTGVVQFKRLVKHHTLPNKLFEEKYKVLIEILKKLTFQQCMVFSNYHSRAEHLSRTLIKEGWPSTHIAGSQMQSDRLKAIDKLKTFQCRILITTDLTARGIDCDKVNLVINLDIPWNAETYLHRVGRAGRFGSQGIAISLVSSSGEEKDRLEEIARSISRELTPLPELTKLHDLWSSLDKYRNKILTDEKLKNVEVNENKETSTQFSSNESCETKLSSNEDSNENDNEITTNNENKTENFAAQNHDDSPTTKFEDEKEPNANNDEIQNQMKDEKSPEPTQPSMLESRSRCEHSPSRTKEDELPIKIDNHLQSVDSNQSSNTGGLNFNNELGTLDQFADTNSTNDLSLTKVNMCNSNFNSNFSPVFEDRENYETFSQHCYDNTISTARDLQTYYSEKDRFEQEPEKGRSTRTKKTVKSKNKTSENLKTEEHYMRSEYSECDQAPTQGDHDPETFNMTLFTHSIMKSYYEQMNAIQQYGSQYYGGWK